MTKKELLDKASVVGAKVSEEMTNKEIEKAIADKLADGGSAQSQETDDKTEGVKHILYDNGTKVPVAAKDANRIANEINDTTKHKVKVV